jgi:hypothetical protein
MKCPSLLKTCRGKLITSSKKKWLKTLENTMNFNLFYLNKKELGKIFLPTLIYRLSMNDVIIFEKFEKLIK